MYEWRQHLFQHPPQVNKFMLFFQHGNDIYCTLYIQYSPQFTLSTCISWTLIFCRCKPNFSYKLLDKSNLWLTLVNAMMRLTTCHAPCSARQKHALEHVLCGHTLKLLVVIQECCIVANIVLTFKHVLFKRSFCKIKWS